MPDLEITAARLHDLRAGVDGFRSMLLANLLKITEIPSPTFGEEVRVRALLDRFTEVDGLDASDDEAGNALGFLAGRTGERTIALVAHVDTHTDPEITPAASAMPDRVVGPGITDNSLGVAMLASIPSLLDGTGIALDSNLLLAGVVRSLGRGDLGGARFLLDHPVRPIHYGLCVEGVKLGRLNYHSLGMLRCEITARIPEEYDYSRFGESSAIISINEIINRILEIPRPPQPRSSIMFGSVRAGSGFNTVAHKARLRFEIRSECGEQVQELEQQISDLTAEVGACTPADIGIEVIARRQPGGLDAGHGLVRAARGIQAALDIESAVGPSLSELSAFIDAGIPALTLGLSHGGRADEADEYVEIEPIITGMTQVLGVLLAIDKGCGDGGS